MNKRIRLNHTDFMFLAMEDVLPSQGILTSIRFRNRHSVDEIRGAVRHMLTIFPRLRTIVSPTLFSYCLQVIDDHDERLEFLFNDAFRIKHGLEYNTEAYFQYRRDLFNEPYALEQGLPIKVRYLPDSSTPVLLFNIHHMICDASSKVLVDSLLAFLNGIAHPIQPIENPSTMPALLHSNRLKLPHQILTSYRFTRNMLRKNSNDVFLNPSTRPAHFWGPVDIHTHVFPYSVNELRLAAKKFDATLTVFLLTALTMTLSHLPVPNKGNSIGIIVPVDLRPYFPGQPPVFGNYISTCMIRTPLSICQNKREISRVIGEQLTVYLDALRAKDVIIPELIQAAYPLMGKKFYSEAIRHVKQRGLLSKSCGFSNIGSLDAFNSHGTRSQVIEYTSNTPSHGLLMVMGTLEDRINISFSYQEAEFTRGEILEFVKSFENMLSTIISG